MAGTGNAASIGIDELTERLADAIQDGRLRDVLTELRAEVRLTEAARVRVEQAVDAVTAIDAAIAAERARLTEHLTARGVSPSGVRTTADPRPLHVVTASVAPAEVDRAIDALAACGYRRRTHKAPIAPPSASEPVSPINT